jgi:hypothetical protein
MKMNCKQFNQQLKQLNGHLHRTEQGSEYRAVPSNGMVIESPRMQLVYCNLPVTNRFYRRFLTYRTFYQLIVSHKIYFK